MATKIDIGSIILVLIISVFRFGCGKEEVAPITVPDVIIEEVPSELPEDDMFRTFLYDSV